MFEAGPVGREPPSRRSGGRARTAGPRINIRLHPLIEEFFLAAAALAVEQYSPIEDAPGTSERPEVVRLLLEPLDRLPACQVHSFLRDIGLFGRLAIEGRFQHVAEILQRGRGRPRWPIFVVEHRRPIRPDVQWPRACRGRNVAAIVRRLTNTGRRPSQLRKAPLEPRLDGKGRNQRRRLRHLPELLAGDNQFLTRALLIVQPFERADRNCEDHIVELFALAQRYVAYAFLAPVGFEIEAFLFECGTVFDLPPQRLIGPALEIAEFGLGGSVGS